MREVVVVVQGSAQELSKPRSLTAPVMALVASIVVALLAGPVEFGPLFYLHRDGRDIPQVIAHPGSMTGVATCFLVFPSVVWLVARKAQEVPTATPVSS